MDHTLKNSYRNATILIIILAVLKAALHIWANLHDHFFRDEFYYIACGEHPGFGYVDHPPLVALIAWLTQTVLGNSLFALRLPVVITGALTVFLTGHLARELGGNAFAQVLAALLALFLPIGLAVCSIYSMNAFDVFFWLLAAWLLVKIVKNEKPMLWIFLGVVMGLGLMNKISMLFFGFGLFVAILLTPQRRWFLDQWVWITASIPVLMFLPHIVWQIVNGWPTLEFMNNARLYKNLPMSPLAFMKEQILLGHPFFVPVWLSGLYWYFFSPNGKRFRLLGWIYLAVLAILIEMNGKPYYLGPVYCILLAAGAVCITTWIERLNWNWLKPAIVVIVVAGGISIVPIAIPILPPETYIAYSHYIGIEPGSDERGKQGVLPQFFADRHGWKEMVETIAGVYLKLSPEEQSQCVIFTGNYGEAGAIDYFGEQYGLPKARSGHNSYYLWGPGDRTGEIVIAFGVSRKGLESKYGDVTQAATIVHEFARPNESDLPVYLCRQPKNTLQEIWPNVKNYN